MERSEQVGLGLAAAGHVLLFGLLSAQFLPTPNPLKLESKPIDISLVDAVALESAAPASAEAPAVSQAPDSGPPEDAPPPATPVETIAEPVPPLPAPVPKPAPRPAPAPAPAARTTPPPPRPAPAPKAVATPAPPKPQPQPKPPAARPAPAQPAAKSAPAPAAKPRPDRLASVVAGARGSDAAAKATRPRGSLLGDDFRKGLAASPEKGSAPSPRSANVSATAVAGLGDAIARQVQPCANRIPNPGPGANLIRSKLRIRMNPDGTLAARPALTGQVGVNEGNQRYAQRVGELATAAIIACAPYELPADLYEGGWKDIIINYRLPG